MKDILIKQNQQVADFQHIELSDFIISTKLGSVSLYGKLKAFPETYTYPKSPIRIQADFLDSNGKIVKITHSLFTYALNYTNYFGFYIPCGSVNLDEITSVEVYPVFLTFIDDADEME